MILLFFLIYINILNSQNDLRDVVFHINSNYLNKPIDSTDLKLIKSSNFIDSLFIDEFNQKEIISKKIYNLYQNKFGLVFEIVENDSKWFFTISECGDYKLMISDYGSFFLYETKKKLLFFVSTNVGDFMFKYEFPVKIEYIESIHYVDHQLNPILSVVLNNEIPMCTSFYNYYTDYILEDLYLEKPRNFRHHNIMDMQLNKFCFFMEGGPHTFSFYRKVKIKRKIKENSLFWFMSPNYGIVD